MLASFALLCMCCEAAKRLPSCLSVFYLCAIKGGGIRSILLAVSYRHIRPTLNRWLLLLIFFIFVFIFEWRVKVFRQVDFNVRIGVLGPDERGGHRTEQHHRHEDE